MGFVVGFKFGRAPPRFCPQAVPPTWIAALHTPSRSLAAAAQEDPISMAPQRDRRGSDSGGTCMANPALKK